MDQNLVKERAHRAIDRFHDHDSDLLERSVSEWSVAHKLAEYLQDEFPRWNVDCEYNKHGEDDKEDPRESEDGNVRPDIIIHRRGNDLHNLVVFELKKEYRSDSDIAEDRDVVESFQEDGEYDYKYGYQIIVSNSLEIYDI